MISKLFNATQHFMLIVSMIFDVQTPEGRPLSFYVKKVNPDTLGWKAGIEAGDRIVQVSTLPNYASVASVRFGVSM